MNISERYGVPAYKRPRFNSNGKSVTKIDDWQLYLGVGSKDYPAFLSAYLDSSGSIRIAVRNGSDHNATPDGDIGSAVYTQQNILDKATISSLTTIVAHGGRQLTDPSVYIASSGRIFIFFLIEPTGKRQLWYVYSDNNGVSWSAEIRMTLDYDDNQITSPGEPFDDGEFIYKSCYARGVGAGSREGVMYKKALTDDFSVQNSFTKMPNLIYQIEAFNGEEPTFRRLSNGIFFGFVRSDPDNKMYKVMSYDRGVNYSRISNAFPGLAKTGFDVSPSGTIFGISRENGGTFRTIYCVSYDMGKTFTTGYADARTGANMYGRAMWHPQLNMFVAMYATETGAINNSPIELVCATFSET
jgi:hypothetical protein